MIITESIIIFDSLAFAIFLTLKTYSRMTFEDLNRRKARGFSCYKNEIDILRIKIIVYNIFFTMAVAKLVFDICLSL